VAVLKGLDQPVLLINGVDKWARSAWVAYEGLHAWAREAVKMAISGA
jgi:hypothetical protein